MKKLLLMILILSSCTKTDRMVDPLRYRGCVVDYKERFGNYCTIRFKLIDSLRIVYGKDYIKIKVSPREYSLFSINDTIK